MLFHANKLLSFSSQPSGFSYFFEILNNSPTGSLTLGFSGQSGKLLEYRLVSGKLFDQDSHFVYSWPENVTISGNYKSGKHSYFVNGVPIKTEQSLVEVGQVDSLFVFPSNFQPEINFLVNGLRPNFIFSPIRFDQFNKTGAGYMVNTGDTYFQVYSGLSNSDEFSWVSGYSGVLLPGHSGEIVFRKNFEPFDSTDYTNSVYDIPAMIYTNFGTLDTGLHAQNVFPVTQSIFLEFDSPSGVGSFNNFFSWSNLVGEEVLLTDYIPISISLTRISGSGVFSGIYSIGTGLNVYPYEYTQIPFYTGSNSYSGTYYSIGESGLSLEINRFIPGSGEQIMRLDIVGSDQTISVDFTGV